MLSRERTVNTLKFKPVDRIPLVEWGIREATMNEWILQGYPERRTSQQFFSLDTFRIGVPINMRMLPAFEEKIIEKNTRYKIWQDKTGAIRKDFVNIDTPGFVTRSWLSFPVETRDDFLKIKKRYNSQDSSRYPDNWSKKADILNKSHVPVHLSFPFLFWTARDWMGFENLCVAFYDMPKLIEEMFEFITDFCIDTLKRGIKDLNIDIVEFKEDMAYKNAPMISPDMFRKFMLPHYIRMVDFLKGNGVKVVFVDCDGYPGDLIPLWIKSGADAMSPCEIAAGNNLLKLRKEYPSFALMGGIDKRVLAMNKQDIYIEVVSKVPYLIETGGYIPHIDHAIPSDVPLRNYMYYRKILTKIAYGQSVSPPV